MKRRLLQQNILILLVLIFILSSNVVAQDKNQKARLAKLVIDSAQLEHYKIALKEEIEASVMETKKPTPKKDLTSSGLISKL